MEFAAIAEPAPQIPFPRGENAERRYHEAATTGLPQGLHPLPPGVLAKTPADGRTHLLPEEIDLHTRIARRMVLNTSALDGILEDGTSRILAPTVSQEILTLQIESVKSRSANSHTFKGRVVGEENTSDVQLVYHDGVLQGNIARYSLRQEIEYRILADGHMMVREIDQKSMNAPCGNSLETSADVQMENLEEQGINIIPQEVEGEPAGDTVGWRVIDVVVGYDAGARVAQGGYSQIEALIIASVDRMSTAFANSLVSNTELILLGTIEDPTYVYPGITSGDMGEELADLNSFSDGVLDTVSNYATRLGADFVSFVLKDADGSAGIAYRPGRSSITARTYMTATRITFAHELGHNLGCDHSWGDSSQATTHSNYGWRLDPDGAVNPDGSPSTTGDLVRTIMAYDWNWGIRIPHFANPNVNFNGTPTGAPNGHDVRTDTRGDQRYYQNGLEFTNGVIGFDGTKPSLGANNANTIHTGGGVSNYGATYASNRAIRTAFNVISPSAGAQWEKGSSYTISFNGGDMDDSATLKLFKGGVLQSTIASNLNPATDRESSWTPPVGLVAGSDYMIRVELIRNGSTFTADSGIFSVLADLPRVLSHTPAASPAVPAPVSQLSVNFNSPMNPATFSTGGDILSFTAPGSTSIASAITGSSWSAGNTVLTINFTGQSQPGVYQMVLGPQIQDAEGNPMDQDIDEIPGESPQDRYTANFSVAPPPIYTATMDTNPGWTLQGAWAWGTPTGSSGDPTSGHTGPNVIGYNLTGAYTSNLAETHATTPIINCSNRGNVRLSFYRRLGVESGSYDKAYIRVSNNGNDWTNVFAHNTSGNGTIEESAWSLQSYDISAVADNQATVYVRWTMGTTDGSVVYAGWNIDDVVIDGDLTGSGAGIVIAESGGSTNVSEGGNTDTYSMALASQPSASVTITFTPDSQVTVSPTTRTFTTGNWATPQNVTVTAVNDPNIEISPHIGSILHSASSADTNYNGINLSGVLVNITDNDNNAPVVNAGPDQSVFLTGNTWSPLTLAPKLWLDASDDGTITLNGATVSQWADKSGFSRHATASGTSQPTNNPTGLNGKRVLTFDGSTDVLNVDLDFLAGVSHSAFVVAKPTVYSNIYGAANSNAGANSLHVGFRDNASFRMNYWGNDWYGAIGTDFKPNEANILNYVWTPGTSKQIFANGTSQGTTATAGTIGTMSGGGRIGRTTGHAFFGGEIAEFIAITGSVSLTDRQAVEGYLAHKWGVTGWLPAAHPYKTNGPDNAEAIAGLDGTASDADSQTLASIWTFVSGPAPVAFANANSIDTAATFTAAGTYTLRLTTNDGYTQVSDDVVITVNPIGSGYNVTYAANGSTGGSVPVDGGNPYLNGAPVTVLGNTGALVRTGHAFNNWNTATNGSGTSYAAGSTFNISGHTTLYAQWTLNAVAVVTNTSSLSVPEGGNDTFQVKLSAQPAASTSVAVARSSGDNHITVQSGASLTFTTANWNTYQTVTLAAAEDNGDNTDGSAIITCTAPGVTATTVTATEVDDDYVLSVAATHGAVTKNPDTAYHDHGSLVQLTATPASGYHFTNWSGDASGSENPLNVTMSAAKSVTANFEVKTLTLTIASTSISESAGSAATTATVTRNSGSSGALTVSLSSSDPTEAGVPTTVEIPDGQTSAIFNIDAVAEDVVDDTQSIILTATALDHLPGMDTLEVTDDDTPTFTLTIAADSIAETNGAAATTATVTRNTDTTGDLTVSLASSDSSEITVPASIIIPAGETSAAFPLNAVDDDLLDGTQTVTITASEPGIQGVIASTDFTGRTVSGGSAGSITWAANGIADPGDLTTNAPDGLFNTPDAQGYFAPDRNIETEGPWTLVVPIVLTDDQRSLTSVVLEYSHFSNSGAFQTSGRITDWTAVLSGSTSGQIGTVTVPGASTIHDTATLTFPAPLVLDNSQTYSLTITASSLSTTGNNTGINALTINGLISGHTSGSDTIAITDNENPTYTVAFSGNGSTSGTAPEAQIKVHNTDLTLATNSGGLTRTDHIFSGWNTAADGMGTDYAAGGSYATNTSVTLYAKWVVSAYASWAESNFIDPEFDPSQDADPDGDGLSNFQEFAFGTAPTRGHLGPISIDQGGHITPGMPTIMPSSPPPANAPPFQAVFPRRKDYQMAGINYVIEFSADLGRWTPSSSVPSVLTSGGEGEIDAVSVPFPELVPLLDVGSDLPPKFFRTIVSEVE